MYFSPYLRKCFVLFLPLILVILLADTACLGQDFRVQMSEFGKTLFPDKSAKGICKDYHGFIWIGTDYNGLARFDGINFEYFTEESHGLFNRHVKYIIALPDSLLLIHYVDHYNNLSGFEVFDPITYDVFSLEDYIEQEIPFDIFAQDMMMLQNLDGSIWFHNKDSIWELKNKNISGKASIPDFYLSGDIYKGPSDNYWIVKSDDDLNHSKAYYLNPQGRLLSEYKYRHPKRTLNVCVSGALICTSSSVVYLNNGQSVDTLLFGDTSAQNIRFYSPYQEQIWSISTKNPKSIAFYDHEGQLVSSAFVTHPRFNPSMLLHVAIWYWDTEGGLWFQCEEGLGLLQLIPNNFQRYIYSSDSPKRIRKGYPQTANPIRGITKDKYGNLFVNSVWTRRRNEGKTTFRRLAQLPDRQQALFADKTGHIWTSTFNGRVLEYNPLTEKIQEHFLDPSIINNKNTQHTMYWALYRDKQGRMWIGRKGGLSYIDEVTGNQLDFDLEGIKMAFHFYENEKGLWICTSSGLFLMDYDYNIIGHYHKKGTKDDYLAHDIIVHLHEDKDGSFWLASKGGGLIHWNPNQGQQKNYRINTKETDNVLYAVYPDDYNNLWMSSNNGLICFNKDSKEMIIYTEEEGISDNEFNTISHYKDEKGNLYFGSLNGLTVFHPSELIPQNTSAPLALVSVKKYNNYTQADSTITLTVLQQKKIAIIPSDREIKLQFSLLNYKNTTQTQYAYKIEGIDENWNYLKKPEVSLAGLPYGQYKLLLKSKAVGKKWMTAPLEIDLIVHRPFYLSSQFIMAVILGLIFFILALLKFRTRILEQQKIKLAALVESKTATIKKQTAELKSLDQMKSRFFVNISHELRTPLTLILGPLTNLIARKDNAHSEEMLQLQLMKRNSDRLLNLVEEILDLSKLDGQKIAFKENNVKLIDFCQFIYNLFDSSAQIAAIHFFMDYQASEDFILKLDENKAEKILVNLLSNAIKFTPTNGSVQFLVLEKNEKIDFIIKDTGIGIPAKDMPYIFDRFYQSSNNKQGGTGIGLALSKELAKAMRGNLSVKSTINKGSTFTFSVPKIKGDGATITLFESRTTIAPTCTKTASLSDLKTATLKNILIVEDHPDLQYFIQTLLSPIYTIHISNDGLAAKNYLQSCQTLPDLILSDIMMPRMDGIELLTWLKSEERTTSIPVIMLTAKTNQKYKIEALRIGVDDYLTKPFSSKELLARIQNLIYHAQKKQEMMEEDILEGKTADTVYDGLKEEHRIWMSEIEQVANKLIENAELDAASFAKAVFLSPSSLQRRIKSFTGLTVTLYLREIRLQKARVLLEKGEVKTITEVTTIVGSKSPYYFAKKYEERFGKKMTEYF